MFLKLASLSLAAITFMAFGVTSASAQYTTRIEPRPFYGATVTLEEGVRVIRPLPPERHVIINPDNATPLTLGFNETRVYENRVVRNYNYNQDGASTSSYRNRYGYYMPGFYAGASGLGRYGGHYLVPRGPRHGIGGGTHR
ncbi:MAG TPA: hypothetical protein PLD46_09595 [Hyphomicrobium sp.]|nr:hypothetical protein [Hyphomicrobium sp.]